MTDAEMHRQIAALGATVEAIGARVIESDQRRQDAEREASKGRARLYEKVEEIGRGLHGLQILSNTMQSQLSAQAARFESFAKETDSRVASLEEKERTARAEIDDMRPKINQFAKWEQRGIGIGIALTVLGTMFGALLVTLREKVVRLFVA